MSEELRQKAKQLDADTVAFYLEVPRSQMVLLQAYFELHDGVGMVRTLEGERPLACILTTPSMKEDCIGVLEAIKQHVAWVATDE